MTLRPFLACLISLSMAALSVGPLLPQVWRCWGLRRSAGLTLTGAWLGPLTCLTWLGYGALHGDATLITINVVCGLLSTSVLVAILTQQPGATRRPVLARTAALPLAGMAVVVGFLAGSRAQLIPVATTHTVLATLAVGLAALANLSQPVKLTAMLLGAGLACGQCNISGISALRFQLGIVGALVWLTHGALHGQRATMLSSALAGLCCVVVLLCMRVISQAQAQPLHAPAALQSAPAHTA